MRKYSVAGLCGFVAALSVTPYVVGAQQGKDLPLKYVGPPTTTPISAGDLMTRLYIYADDSLMGRQFGTPYNVKATAYIEREARRLGLQPAGDSGGYFQYLPYFARALDSASTLTVGGTTFKAGSDFLIRNDGRLRALADLQAVYLGALYDTIAMPDVESIRGKLVAVRPFVPPAGFNAQAFVQSGGFKAYQRLLAAAGGVVTLGGEQLDPNAVRSTLKPTTGRMISDTDSPIALSVTSRVAEAMFGGPLSGVAKGAVAKGITATARFNDAPLVARNVVAILPGSDPALKNEYVAVGAHNDHIGFRTRAVDHDSVKAFMQIVRPQGADNDPVQPSPEQIAQVRAMTDSLHALHGGARPDSIFNGADDDGSGTVSVLEIAEAFAGERARPKRSILFVWHTGEEAGLIGSGYFTDHPTVPRDAVVAQLNIDMIGRGRAGDATGSSKEGAVLHGGPGYLQLVGARRLSTELGDIIESTNKSDKLGINFDYAMDANGHPQNIYCRSDHYEYARYGIPIVFFTTGGHADYHQVTDEPQYIDYTHMADIAKLVHDAALSVANLNHRVVVDKAKPDPKGSCVQ